MKKYPIIKFNNPYYHRQNSFYDVMWAKFEKLAENASEREIECILNTYTVAFETLREVYSDFSAINCTTKSLREYQKDFNFKHRSTGREFWFYQNMVVVVENEIIVQVIPDDELGISNN